MAHRPPQPHQGLVRESRGQLHRGDQSAQTWGLISGGLTPAGTDWSDSADGLIKPQAGPAVNAYLGWQETHTDAITQLVGATKAMQESIATAAGIVGFVHGFLRDILAQLVGAAISWATEALLSLGTLIPWICGQIGTRVAAVTAKCSKFVTGLTRSGGKLSSLLKLLGTWGKNVLKLLDKIKTNPNLHRPTPRHAAPTSGTPDIPPWTWKPPPGYNPRPGTHRAPEPTFPEHMRDAARDAKQDAPYTGATNLGFAGRDERAGKKPPEEE